MKKTIFLCVTMSSLLAGSSTVLAGGPGCDSLKGHSKELSAETLKQFQSDHAWLFSDDGTHSDNKMKSQDQPGNEPETKKVPSAKMIEI